MKQRRSLPLVLAVLGTVALLAGPASADGAFPDEFSIHFAPDAPHRIYLGANFGLLVSEDDGQTWRYACEPWVVTGSNAALTNSNVIFYQVAADGTLLADSVQFTRSADVACTWPAATGLPANQQIADIFPDPNDASFVLAILVVTGGGSAIAASHDGGKSFGAQHVYDTGDLLTGVEIAKKTPGKVYATSFSTSGGAAKFLASADSGATWTATSLNLAAGFEPRIFAIDPDDANKVYLRVVSGLSDQVFVTTNGGQTFQEIPGVDTTLSSFLRAQDGTVYAGAKGGKLFVQAPGTAGFKAQPAPHLRCLGQRPGSPRIYACADMVVDGYSLGYSDDQGATFHKLMSFTELLGPLTCAPVQTNCQAHWDRIQGVLGLKTTDAGTPVVTPDAGTTPPPPTSRGSSCASTAVNEWNLWIAVAFVLRRWRRART